MSLVSLATTGSASLPPLREELKLYPGPPARDGAPGWTLHDPATNRYVRLGWLEIEFLRRWALGSPEAVLAAVRAETTLTAAAADLDAFVRFLADQQLLAIGHADASRLHAERRARLQRGWASWLLHHYLFLRVTLLRPDALLRAMQPWLAWVWTRVCALTVAVLALGGLLAILGRWERFTHEFPFDFDLRGALAVGACLAVSKVLHEFGHACTLHHYGCRVPAMGVAFIVFWPVCWTDASAAWQLVERRKRLAIGAAGVLVELALAAIASWLWLLLPDGALRNGMHVLAGTAWLLTLAVNLNPLMRFDGYHLLADALDEPNLQARSFALGRWRLREALFGLGEAPPERLPAARRRLLVAYAWATWVYRFGLFVGIALAVYHYFFKALGIALMLVELGWFIALPLYSELRAWHERRARLRHWRAWRVPMLLLAALAALLLLPWHGSVSAPAVLLAAREVQVFAGQPGRIQKLAVAEGSTVAAGERLLVLDNPDLEHRIATLTQQLAVLEAVTATHTLDARLNDRNPIERQELLRVATELEGARAQAARLTVRAPWPGRVADLAPDLREGAWLGAAEPLLTLVGTGAPKAVGYVAEADLHRIAVGARASFHASDRLRGLQLRITRIEPSTAPRLPELALASPLGGDLAARLDEQQSAIPIEARYRIELQPEDASLPPPSPPLPGELSIETPAEALIVRLWREVVGALVRESGW